jgi:hypothetical protein
VPLPLASLTPTTPDCTGKSFSRVWGVSKSKKSKSSRLLSKQLFRQTHRRPWIPKNGKTEEKKKKK